jgi:fatty-acyl-CoA synthase
MNLGEWVFKRALTYPDRPFLKQRSVAYDNRRFNDRVNRTARGLMGLGVKKGDRVATLMINSSAFLEIFFACAKIGAIVVPVNFKLAGPEIEQILRDCTAGALVYSSEFVDTLRSFRSLCDDITCRLVHGEKGLAGDPTLAEAADASSAAEPVCRPEPRITDPLIIVYTSGTTGTPKGAVLSHQNLLFGAIHSLLGYGIDAACKSLVIAPLFHVGALAASVTPVVYAGGSLVLEDFENPSEIVQLITREQINYMFAVPVMYEMMAKAATWEAADFSHVHFFISGGAPMPVSLIRKYQKEKGVRFAQGYAMTETLRLTSLDLDEAVRKVGSVGKEVFHTLLQIVDDTGRPVPPGEIGEIWVRGPTVFLHYWNRPQETAATLQDGWFKTGDLARRDPEGFIYIVGRKKDMIIRSGENIYAAEVEQAIVSIPGVAEAAAVGMPDPKRGEAVAAYVVMKSGRALSDEDLIAGLQGRIAPFKIPKKIVFVSEFPRNAAGKILKAELKAALIPDRPDR